MMSKKGERITDDDKEVVRDFFDVIGKAGNHAAREFNDNNMSDFDKLLADLEKSISAVDSLVNDVDTNSSIKALIDSITQNETNQKQYTEDIISKLLPPKKPPGGVSE